MKNIRILAIAAIFLAACRGAENKADTKPNKEVDTTTTIVVQQTQPAEGNKPETPVDRSPEVAPPPPPPKKTPNPDIISRIDDHLISTSNFTPGPTGGITNASVTVKNTLSGITIQRALLEVSIRNADGSEVKTDYYTVINLEPGGSKLVNIPNTTKGSKMVLHIVKVKSDQLTNGEFVLSGSHAQK